MYMIVILYATQGYSSALTTVSTLLNFLDLELRIKSGLLVV